MHRFFSTPDEARKLFALFAILLMQYLTSEPKASASAEETNRSSVSPYTVENETEERANGPTYKVDLSQALTRYVMVTMTAESQGDETQLMLPTWTPGSYLIREYAKHIDRISAKDADGNPLNIVKTSKNHWRLDTKNVKRFQVSYRLFCNEDSVRTNSVNFNRAVLNGAATFLSIPEQHDRVHRIKLIMPKSWSTSSTSLRRGRGEHNYTAENYDEVVDSPIVAGNVMVYPFEVAGVPHYLVNVGQSNDFDHVTAIGDLTKLVEQHQRLWGEVPYDRYYFITVFGGGGGLEHDNCCLMMVSRLDTRDRASYRGWLSLASHEFFHTWNIRRLRPKELVKYDYENETYTPSLWIAEGTTSYYEDLLLLRAGLVDRDEYLHSLNLSIQQLQRTEGRLVQSLRDSSHDAWIKFYRPESNSNSTQISYYTKGAIVSLLLDVRIRVATDGAKSLDDVLRLLWARHKFETGYSESEFRQLCSEVAGEDLSQWFAKSVDSTDELDYQEIANWFGLEIGNVKPKAEESTSEKTSGDVVEADQKGAAELRRWIGIGEFDSPATKAGLADTDEVIAINGQRTTESSVESTAQKFAVGEPIKVMIARDGKLEEILLVVGARDPVINWAVRTAGRTTRQQRKNLKQWMASLSATTEPAAEKAGNSEKDAEKAEQGDTAKETEPVEDPKSPQRKKAEADKSSGGNSEPTDGKKDLKDPENKSAAASDNVSENTANKKSPKPSEEGRDNEKSTKDSEKKSGGGKTEKDSDPSTDNSAEPKKN